MASIKVLLRNKTLKTGEHPIILQIIHKGKPKIFTLGISTYKKHWNARLGEFRNSHPNHLQFNRVIDKMKIRARNILSEFAIEEIDFTLDDFEHRFRLEARRGNQNIFDFWEEIVEELKFAGRIGNARVNADSRRALIRFNNGTSNLNFKEVDLKLLQKFEAHLRNRGGTDGGIGVKMRALRAVYNLAIERGIVNAAHYPFRAYKISKLKGKSIKCALTLEEVKLIENLNIQNNYSYLLNFRNYFIFSFYTRGMNFADMMQLKWTDVQGEYVRYIRAKTKGRFSIKILPPVQRILDHYSTIRLDTPYIFPILLKEGLSPEQIENRKNKVLKQYNKALKELAYLAKVDKTITSYVARHSYATCLKRKGVSTDIISESLGHSDIKVTQTYLKEFEDSVIEEASELLL